MNTGLEKHIPEELLEAFAMRMLSGEHCARVEEHLLVCADCQIKLQAIDEYVEAMKGALAAKPPQIARKRVQSTAAALRALRIALANT